MQTKHLCVLIHIWTKGEVGAPWNWFKLGLLRVSEYSDIRKSWYIIEYEYSSLSKSLDRDLFFFFF